VTGSRVLILSWIKSSDAKYYDGTVDPACAVGSADCNLKADIWVTVAPTVVRLPGLEAELAGSGLFTPGFLELNLQFALVTAIAAMFFAFSVYLQSLGVGSDLILYMLSILLIQVFLFSRYAH
jgi:hypothetical protein